MMTGEVTPDKEAIVRLVVRGPNETKEHLAWLVLTDGAAQIEAYATLSKVCRLP